MVSFDFKLIIIIVLAIVIYFMYREIETIRKKLNVVINKVNSNFIENDDDISILNYQDKNNKNDKCNLFDMCDMQKYDLSNPDMNQDMTDLNHDITDLNHDMTDLNQNMTDINQNINNYMNTLNSNMFNLFPNLGSRIMIQKVHIPIKPTIILNESDLEETYNNLNFENTINENGENNRKNDRENYDENNRENENGENNRENENGENDRENKNGENDRENKKEDINDDKNDRENENDDENEKNDEENDETADNVTTNNKSKHNSENSSSAHLDVFSNDTEASIAITNNILVDGSKTHVLNDDIIKNINKYKLPELQDFAIELKINLQNNLKKKTKVELINDIKNFYLKNNI